MTAPSARLRITPESGHLFILTRREGLASRVGHDLRIEATRWSAQVTHNPSNLSATTISATIEPDSLQTREGTGGAGPLSDRDRSEIDTNIRRILGSSPLTFTSTRIVPDGTNGTVEGELTLNGVTRPVRLEVTSDDGVHYRAEATIVQSEYGIRPYRAFLGALKLRDQIEVQIDVDLDRVEHTEPATGGAPE
jgi:polyisoprenoid-binding protein YceI